MSDEDYARLFREPEKPSASAAWEDVAHEVQALGPNLAAAFRAAWQRQDYQAPVRDLQASLQAMLDAVARAVDESTATPEAQQARDRLNRVAESVRTATERTTQELRPQLLAALRQVNEELRRLGEPPDRREPPSP
jgi:type VI protein secretion system component VasF